MQTELKLSCVLLLVTLLFLVSIYPQTPNKTSIPSTTLKEKQHMPTNYGYIPNTWGGYNTYHAIVYTSVAPPSSHQITAYDTTTERTPGAGSVRIDPYEVGSENTAREVNTDAVAVSPGMVFQFIGYIKTETDSGTTFYPRCGGRLGIDIYGALGRITSKQSSGPLFAPDEDDDLIGTNWVADASGGAWQQRTLSFTVPSTLPADVGAAYPVGTLVTPTSIIPWLQASPEPLDESATSVWFADITIYLNPSEGGVVSPVVLASYLSQLRKR